jgi:tetratricopeptide (TPR) repeat protein
VRADFLVYNQSTKDARILLEQVLREDPSNASAHETMGYLEFRQGNLAEARKWYEQAVKLNSQCFLAYYYFAAIMMNGGPLDPENKSQVENSLRTAIQLNPSFAPAYDQLAVFYGMRRENLDEAHTLVLNAVQLDPGNVRYRLSTANIPDFFHRTQEIGRVVMESAQPGCFVRADESPDSSSRRSSEWQRVVGAIRTSC